MLGKFEKQLFKVVSFTDGGNGGNPAGVMLDSDFLSQSQKQQIATDLGMSETAFVSKSNKADYRLEFFTPTKQIAHCGHATIACFYLLQKLGKINRLTLRKETIDGNRTITFKDSLPFLELPAAKFRDPIESTSQTYQESLRLLGVNRTQLDSRFPPCIAGAGVDFLLLGLKRSEDLKKIRPDFENMIPFSKKHNLIGFYVFSLDPEVSDRDATARMFAPDYGIEEEPATGMASAALIGVLQKQGDLNKQKYQIEQGAFMTPRTPSLILGQVERKDGEVSKILVGGHAKLVEETTVVIPENVS